METDHPRKGCLAEGACLLLPGSNLRDDMESPSNVFLPPGSPEWPSGQDFPMRPFRADRDRRFTFEGWQPSSR
jgi:hypothetical protein